MPLTMTTKNILINRADELISIADDTIAAAGSDNFGPLFSRFRAQSLSFINDLYGTSKPYYSEFEITCRKHGENDVKNCKGILTAIRQDIDNGYYLATLSGLVLAEIFSNYLDMANYYLDENHKDAAAVIIGSTLENHLRSLSTKNIPPPQVTSNTPITPKTANALNDDLYKAKVYDKVNHAMVGSWVKIRNEAAHGNYQVITKQQVELMLTGVRQFVASHPL